MASLVRFSDLWLYFVPTHKILTKCFDSGQRYGYKIQDGGRLPLLNCNDVIYDYPH